MRTKPWPFVNNSLFTVNPAQDSEDREVFDHVLKLLREDFCIDTDNKEPRFQILLDDVVSAYTDLSVFKSKIKPEDDLEVVRRHGNKLRSQIRKSLDGIMKYKNTVKKTVDQHVTIENLLNRGVDDGE